MNSMSLKAKLLLVVVVLVAVTFFAYSLAGNSQAGLRADRIQFAVLLFLAVAAARMKVRLPGMDSNMSMNLPFILIATFQLSLLQALTVAGVSTLLQCLSGTKQQFRPSKIVFNVCNLCNAVALACFAGAGAAHLHFQNFASTPLFIIAAALAFFVASTVPVAAIMSLTGNGNVAKIWGEISVLSLPYFVLSTATAAILATAGYYRGLALAVVLLIMFGVYSSFKRYFRDVALRPKLASVAHA